MVIAQGTDSLDHGHRIRGGGTRVVELTYSTISIGSPDTASEANDPQRKLPSPVVAGRAPVEFDTMASENGKPHGLIFIVTEGRL